jgi:hypothetical protein
MDWKRWVGVVLLALLLALFERYQELAENDLCGARTGIEALLSHEVTSYQRLAAAGYRPARSHFVTVVLLRHDHDPENVLANPCSQRLYLSKLLNALQMAAPSLIVFDKAFAAEACNDDSINQALRDAVQATRITLVIGLQTKTMSDLIEIQGGTLTQVQKKGFESACLYSVPRFVMDKPGSSARIRYGLMRLNSNERKIPLQWPTYPSKEDVGKTNPELLPSLALVAASEYNQSRDGQRRIEQLKSYTYHPFTSFITESNPSLGAWELICRTPIVQTADWTSCVPNANGPDLHNQIVLIGDDVPERDQHKTDAGKMPGVLLQANYIESLLDDRFLKPVSLAFVLVANGAWIIVLELLFWKLDSPELALLLAVISTAALWSACYLLTALTGYFLTLATPGFLYLLVRWGISRGHKWASSPHPKAMPHGPASI